MNHNNVVPPSSSLSLEQKLIDEVLYLHSLWHQGPPHSHSDSHSDSDSNPNPHSSDSSPVSTEKKRVSEPSPTLPAETGSVSGSKPTSAGHNNKEKKLDGLQLQRSYFKAFQDFLATNPEDFEDSENVGTKEFDFFLGVFKEGSELSKYYQSNSEAGEFCCLVCSGTGKKKARDKKFNSCLALVQHSITVSETRCRMAHRAFGQVICRVLGWDISCLPVTVGCSELEIDSQCLSHS